MPVDESRVILAYLQKAPVVCPDCRTLVHRTSTPHCDHCGHLIVLEDIWRARLPFQPYDEDDPSDETAWYVKEWLRIATGREGKEALAEILGAHDYPCYKCGYDLRGVREARCPECGREVRETDLFPIHEAWRDAEPGTKANKPLLVYAALTLSPLLVIVIWPSMTPVFLPVWFVLWVGLAGVMLYRRRARAQATPATSDRAAPW